jgi:hypothetical protein
MRYSKDFGSSELAMSSGTSYSFRLTTVTAGMNDHLAEFEPPRYADLKPL